MNITIGFYSLTLAALIGCLVLLVAIKAALTDSDYLLAVGRRGFVFFTGLITLASAMFMIAMVNADFRLEYVQHYTEKALPVGYRMAAFWAGQEGSLLLWALLLAIMSVIAVYAQRKGSVKEKAWTLAGLMLVSGFFAILLRFAANPFKLAEFMVADGRGLNPMLQDPGMIWHPPALFVGYAGYTIPFAMMIGALLSGRRDNDWLGGIRWWAVVSWLFLTIGIVLGAQWAYVELGWGGYWAWDPVENASLLPWLTGTALLHSIMGQQQRGMLKRWNAWLIAVSFILCIFGTYLTRSGVVQSVHAFAGSMVATFFLVFLILTTVGSVVLILVNDRLLKSEHPLEYVFSREGAFLATNILLVIITAITLVGTLMPLISGIVMKEGVSVGQSFYNTTVAPAGLILASVMAVGPILGYGRAKGNFLAMIILVALLATVIGAAVFAFGFGMFHAWVVPVVAIVATAALVYLADLARSAWARARNHGENLALATFRLLDGNHRRYGGQVVHIGVVMLIVGVTGSSLYNHKDTFQLASGQAASIAGYTFTFEGKLEEIRESNYTAVRANLNYVEPKTTLNLGFGKWTFGGKSGVLQPERRFYDKSEQMNAHVAIASTWRDDLYLTLAGWESGGAPIAVQALINPLTSWIWTGGWLMSIGAIICLIPRLEPRTETQAAVTERIEPAPVAAAQPERRNGSVQREKLRSNKRKVRQ